MPNVFQDKLKNFDLVLEVVTISEVVTLGGKSPSQAKRQTTFTSVMEEPALA